MAARPNEGIYATEFMSGLNFDKPEILDMLYDRRRDQYMSFMKIMDMLGFAVPVAQEDYSHFEDDWYITTLTVAVAIPAATGAAGVQYDITLDPADVLTDALPTPQKHLPARVGDIIMFPNIAGGGKDVQAIVVAVDATVPKISVKNIVSTDVAPEVQIGTSLIIISAAFAEGTGQPTGMVENLIKYTNNLQIIKETWEGTGTEMTNGKWFSRMRNGEKIRAFFAYGQKRMDYRLAAKADGALLFNRKSTSTTLIDPLPDATGRLVRTTEGLVPYIRTNGYTLPYTAGFFSMADFDYSATIAENERAGDNLCVFYGFNLGLELENLLVDFLAGSEVDYTMFGGDKGKAVAVGFRSLKKAGHNFYFKKLGMLSHPKLYNAPGFLDKAGLGIVVPVGKRSAYIGNGFGQRKLTDLPTFGYRYKKLGEHNRKMEIWEINGTSHRPALRKIIAQDVDNLYSRMHIGFHGMAGNQMQLWEPTI